MNGCHVIILADIFPELPTPMHQEWESVESILHLEKCIKSLGYTTEIIEPTHQKSKLMEVLTERLSQGKKANTILWNLVEGFSSRNREGYVPSLAEFFGFPFTGSDATAQSISLDKALTKNIVNSMNINTAKAVIIHDRKKNLILKNISFPAFLKPCSEGSSLGIYPNSVIENHLELKDRIQNIPDELFPLILEEYLPGKEFTIGIIGDRQRQKALRVCEVLVDGVYSESTKSKSEMPEKIIPLDVTEYLEIQTQSLKIFQRIAGYGFGRLDWKLDVSGKPSFLELNLTPGISPFYSSFPISYGEGQSAYIEMVDEILNISLYEYNSKSRDYGKLG